MSPVVDNTIAAINAADTVMEGAITYVNSVPGMIAAAKDEALTNGATAEQLQPLDDLKNTLLAKSDALAQALAANTPVTPVELAKAKAKAKAKKS